MYAKLHSHMHLDIDNSEIRDNSRMTPEPVKVKQKGNNAMQVRQF